MASAALATSGNSSPRSEQTPIAKLSDAKSLERVIHFGLPFAQLRGLSAGEILWRIDVDLPVHASLDHVEMLGYAPVDLHLKDGRCFRVRMNSADSNRPTAEVSQNCTSMAPYRPPPKPLPRPNMRYVGRAWDLSAWSERRSMKTMLFLDREPMRPPLLMTSMRVLAVGGMGCPDCPSTEVTLVGYVGRKLTLATVDLHYP